MEKILALIAVSLGKKATVYAVGRVSARSYPKVQFCRWTDLLCPDLRYKMQASSTKLKLRSDNL